MTGTASWGTWFLRRVAVPLSAMLLSVLSLWGRENVAAVIVVPVLVLVYSMYVAWRERPDAGTRSRDRMLDPLRRNWHALTLLSFFFLMFVEGVAAALAEDRNKTFLAWAAFAGAFVIPYVILSAWAHVQLRCAARLRDNSLVLGRRCTHPT